MNLQALAACQRRLELETIISTVQVSGDVDVSIFAGKESRVPYARIDRLAGDITVLRCLTINLVSRKVDKTRKSQSRE